MARNVDIEHVFREIFRQHEARQRAKLNDHTKISLINYIMQH